MNCAQIQGILDKDPAFSALVARRDRSVTVSGIAQSYAPLTVSIWETLERCKMVDPNRELILAFARRLSIPPPPVAAPEAVALPTVKAAQKSGRAVPKVKAKPRRKPEPPQAPAPLPVAATSLPETAEPKAALPVQTPAPPEPVTVKCTPHPDMQPRPQTAAHTRLERFISSGEVLRFQCSIAAGQLLAALYQLVEQDNQPRNEERKALVVKLVDEYEAMAKTFINLSVKQIIRGRTEEQISEG